jgi:FHA domain
LSARLVALNPVTRPQIMPIETREPDDEFVVGRTNFFRGEDTIISRRHAKFKLVSHPGGYETIVVENLSMINGILLNFRPVPPYQPVTIYDGDEIVSPCYLVHCINGIVFFGGTWIDTGD